MRALLAALLCAACSAPAGVATQKPITPPAAPIKTSPQEREADAAALYYVAKPDANASVIHVIRNHESAIYAAKKNHATRETRRAVSDFSDYLNSRGIH